MNAGRGATEAQATWAADWETRLRNHLRSLGYSSGWHYIYAHPEAGYLQLAKQLSRDAGFGVAAVQLQALHTADTPAADLGRSLRDSLARLLRESFRRSGWGVGSYWRGSAGSAFADWSVMWRSRTDVSGTLERLLALQPPEGWVPAHSEDPLLVTLMQAFEQ